MTSMLRTTPLCPPSGSSKVSPVRNLRSHRVRYLPQPLRVGGSVRRRSASPSAACARTAAAAAVPGRRVTRVKKTGRNRSGNRGYRSNRPGPVPVPAGFKPAQIQILNLNFKTWKNPKKFLKILQVATNLMVSNFFKYSFI